MQVKEIDFKFSRYNPRRAARGVEAVEVIVIENGEEHYLWMSKSDLSKNIMIFGKHPEPEKALSYYTTRQNKHPCPP